MTMTTTSPYAEAFDAYWKAGWRGVLPLPFKSKTWPPTGYTGYDYTEPSYADCATWAEDGQRNIALHLPKGVIGIDVDDYGDKGGGQTLQALVEECGALPATWMSSSRGDGISGIRLFRVPEDARLITLLTGIEMIQYFHRYVVCWPSVHPEGGTYQWVNEATGEGGDIPVFDQIPALPDRWLVKLLDTKERAAKADIDAAGVREFMAGLPEGDPCQHIIAAAGLAMRGGSRHDTYNHAVLGVLMSGRSGCPGAKTVYKRLEATFIADVTQSGDGQRTAAQAQLEWSRNALGAIALVVADKPEQGHGCPDDYVAELILAETAKQPDDIVDAEIVEDDDEPEQEPQAEQAKDDARVLAVARRASEMALIEDARALLASWRAGQQPELHGHDLGAFLAQPDEPVAYRIDGMWPINGRVLLAAAAKAGKTTLVMNLLKALADGGAFLGCYDAVQVGEDRTIVYLNLEVSENQMRRWLRRAGIVNHDRIIVVNLRGQLAALGLATEPGRKRISDWLRSVNAEVVILDPLAPLLGSLGLEEKENSDIARFFAWWSETLFKAGVVDDFICHHAGWDGSRSRGASRLVDEPDAVWTISRDKFKDEDEDDVYGVDEPRFLKAVGRDVEQAELPLIFDGASGLLTLGEGSRKAMRAAALKAQAEARVLAAIDHGNRSKRSIIKAGGNEKQNSEALDSLEERGVIWCEKAGGAHLYSRVSPLSPSVARRQETVSVAALYKGDTTTGTCEDCGGDTGSAGYIVCAGCEKKRRQA